jgi:class 3 adenylate cyclase
MFKRMSFFKHLFSEHTIIAWVMSAAIIPMLLLSFFVYKSAKTMLETTISHVLLTEIKKKVGEINSSISSKKLHLLQFCGLPELKNTLEDSEKNGHIDIIDRKKMADFSSYLHYITPRIGVTNFYLISMDAKTIYTLHDGEFIGEVLSKNQPSHQDLYNSFDGARILRIPYLYTSYEGNPKELKIYLSNIIKSNHKPKAVLIMQLDPLEIKRVVESNFGYTKTDHTSLGMLVDSDPTFVLNTKTTNYNDTTNSHYMLDRKRLLKKAIEGGMAQQPIELLVKEIQLLEIFSYVPQLNMGMVIAYDKSDVYQKIHWLQVNMVVITLIDLLIVIMIVSWIAGSLREAQRKSERLLENILPKFVVDELKEKKQFSARLVSNISVLFMDFHNFTPFCSSKTPEDVIVILDEFFSMFDTLSDKYQLEKIKTIGDAYMSVAGLIVAQDDHASRAIHMALDAIDAVKEYNHNHGTDFAIRAGIDSGNVITGIVGRKKFSYDLWGNAVNCASRMESTGLPNEVQISENTYKALTDKKPYVFKQRQCVDVKGFGIMDTYLVSKS